LLPTVVRETARPSCHLDYHGADHNAPTLQASQTLQSLVDCFHLTLSQRLAALVVVIQLPNNRTQLLPGHGRDPLQRCFDGR
jgi:hypothetical protein